MNRIITYAFNKEDGHVISRVDSEIAVPVIQFAEFGKDGDFTGPLPCKLEKMPVSALAGRVWDTYRWTKKIPRRLKNRHRKFWGFQPIPA